MLSRTVMRNAIARLSADGWTVESDGRYGSLFCHRGSERLEYLHSVDGSDSTGNA
jgi:DNA-binding FadR family transcriptional regulator